MKLTIKRAIRITEEMKEMAGEYLEATVFFRLSDGRVAMFYDQGEYIFGEGICISLSDDLTEDKIFRIFQGKRVTI